MRITTRTSGDPYDSPSVAAAADHSQVLFSEGSRPSLATPSVRSARVAGLRRQGTQLRGSLGEKARSSCVETGGGGEGEACWCAVWCGVACIQGEVEQGIKKVLG